jgi:MYXO-CTERM domain-containing protein
LNNVTLYQPDPEVEPEEEPEEEEEEELPIEEEEEEEEDDGPDDGMEWDTGNVDLIEVDNEEDGFRLSCSSVGAVSAINLGWMALGLGGLVTIRRRRE